MEFISCIESVGQKLTIRIVAMPERLSLDRSGSGGAPSHTMTTSVQLINQIANIIHVIVEFLKPN